MPHETSAEVSDDVAGERDAAVQGMKSCETREQLTAIPRASIPPGHLLVPHEVVQQGGFDGKCRGDAERQVGNGEKCGEDGELNGNASQPDAVELGPSTESLHGTDARRESHHWFHHIEM